MRFLVPIGLLLLAGCSPAPVSEVKHAPAPKTEVGTMVELADLSVSLPEGWKVANFGNAQWKAAFADIAKTNEAVKAMMPMLDQAAKSGFIKLVAFDLASTGSGFANNINIIVTSDQGAPFAKIVAANEEQLRSMATKGHEPKVERKELSNGPWAILDSQVPTGPNGKDIAIKTCLALSNSKVYTITFSALPGKENSVFSRVEPLLGSVKFK